MSRNKDPMVVFCSQDGSGYLNRYGLKEIHPRAFGPAIETAMTAANEMGVTLSPEIIYPVAYATQAIHLPNLDRGKTRSMTQERLSELKEKVGLDSTIRGLVRSVMEVE